MKKPTLALLTLLCFTACNDDAVVSGGDSGSGPRDFLRATVTLTDGTTFSFDERAYAADDDTWTINAHDQSRTFGFIIRWTRSAVSGPGSYELGGLGDNRTQILISRPRLDDPDRLRVSAAIGGPLLFDQISYDSGEIIRGSLDHLTIDLPPEYIHIHETTFRATAP